MLLQTIYIAYQVLYIAYNVIYLHIFIYQILYIVQIYRNLSP